ncbi:MAG: PP2C family protein-serine/threonine phosphatase, partial [candidate division Zixibacteria bacterium]
QRNLLAKSIPELKGYSIHAFQEQCRMVGGDLYDVAKLRDGRLTFVVADVSGKGMGGALLMSNILASFRILYEDDDFDLSRVVKQVSRQLFTYSAPEDFATVFTGILDPVNNTLSFLNAGHNPPLLIKPDGVVQYLEPSGTMIGAFDFSDWQQETVKIGVGDMLLVFTDGVVEADCRGEYYGLERLQELVCKHRDIPLSELSDQIMNDVESFAAGTPRSDDITLLAVKRE